MASKQVSPTSEDPDEHCPRVEASDWREMLEVFDVGQDALEGDAMEVATVATETVATEVGTLIEVCTTCEQSGELECESSRQDRANTIEPDRRREASHLGEQVGGSGRALRVIVVSAEGLRNGVTYPFCACWIYGKPHTKAETKVSVNVSKPIWNSAHTLPDYSEGDTLVFTVYDRDPWKCDERLGTAMLPSNRFRFQPFQGTLQLSDGVSLTIKVFVMAPAPALSRSAMTALPLVAEPAHGSGRKETSAQGRQTDPSQPDVPSGVTSATRTLPPEKFLYKPGQLPRRPLASGIAQKVSLFQGSMATLRSTPQAIRVVDGISPLNETTRIFGTTSGAHRLAARQPRMDVSALPVAQRVSTSPAPEVPRKVVHTDVVSAVQGSGVSKDLVSTVQDSVSDLVTTLAARIASLGG